MPPSPQDSTPKVPSNGLQQFGLGIPAVILYPSLGAPTFVSESEKIHLLVLSKTDLKPAEVNERLRILPDYQAWKTLKHGRIPPTGLVPLFEDLSNIEVLELPEKDKEPLRIDDLGFRGFLNLETLPLWREKREGDRIAPPLEKLYLISLRLANLQGESKQASLGRKFLLHWLDFGINGTADSVGAPDAADQSQPLAPASYQEDRLHRILSETKKSGKNIFIGERLWKFLKEAKPGDSELMPSLDPSGLRADTSLPLTDWHPVHRIPSKTPADAPFEVAEKDAKPAAALDLGVISDLHLVTKLQILKNSELVTIPQAPEALVGTGASSFVRPIGSRISETVTVLKDLFEKLKSGPDAPDAVLVVGDLIDFSRDNFPKDRTVLAARDPARSPSRTQHGTSLWDALNLLHFSKAQESAEEFFEPRLQMGTSYLGIYHLVADFQATCDKPIFLLAGNHDGYGDPFGISPRADFGDGQDAVEHMKANEGIACDTNLTFLEATTAYGPGYNKFTHVTDFDETVYRLFFLLFSPFKSWSISGGTKQQFLLLDWGPSEMMFLRSKGPEGMDIGHLPHADKAIPEHDLALIESVAQDFGTSRRVVQVSHFTYACYDPHVPLVDNFQWPPAQAPATPAPQASGALPGTGAPMLLGGEENIKGFPKADIGTIKQDVVSGMLTGAAIGAGIGVAAGVGYGLAHKQGAGDVAKDALIAGGIGAGAGALIGAGAGALFGAGSRQKSNWHNYGTFNFGRERVFKLIQKGAKGGIAYTLSGHAHRAAFYTPENLSSQEIPDEIKVRGWHLDEFRILVKNLDFESDRCVMIVSDSAGPIPRKNRKGELKGWGSQLPSWTLCAFDDEGRLKVLRSVPTSNATSLPRLSVAMDYLESTVGQLAWTTGMGVGSLAAEGTFLGLKKVVAALYNLFPGHKPWDPDPAAMPRHLFGGEDLPFIWAPLLESEKDPEQNAPSPGLAESTGIVLDLGTGRRQEWLISGIPNLFTGPVFDPPKGSLLPSIRIESSLWPLAFPDGFSRESVEVLCLWKNRWHSFRMTPTKRRPGTTAIRGEYKKDSQPNGIQEWSVASGSLPQTEDFLKSLGQFLTQKKPEPVEMTCWISNRIAGRSDYDTTPWLLEGKLCLAQYQEKWTLLMYRKIWENERPNFSSFKSPSP